MPGNTERAVDHQYFIRAEPAAVFRALTEPAWLARWLCDAAEITPRKGGSYRFSWTGGPTHTGEIVEFDPGQRISLAWKWPGVELDGTVFSLAVEPKEGGSLLRVLHTGFPRREEWTDLYGGAEWGWTYFAMNLKSVLEHGHDLRSAPDG
jgi:uncharacterized protein YndB with AHSA1/START domain